MHIPLQFFSTYRPSYRYIRYKITFMKGNDKLLNNNLTMITLRTFALLINNLHFIR